MSEKLRATLRIAGFLTPFLVGTVLFTLYPLIYVFVVAFQEDYNILTREFSQWGTANFGAVLNDSDFREALANTAVYTATTVPVTVAIGLVLSALLGSVSFLKGFYQTAMFLPLITSSVAIGMVWKYLYNADYGLVNYLLTLAGGDGVNWLNDPRWNMSALIIFGIWSGLPFTIMIFVASLQSIGEQLYVAARIDGAKAIQRFLRITVPLMGPTIGLVTILNLINASKVFSELFPLFNGRPGAGYSLYTIVYYIYEQLSLQWDLGRASAASLVLFAGVLALTLLRFALQHRRDARLVTAIQTRSSPVRQEEES